jgi:putative heme-binding domain-containing protein
MADCPGAENTVPVGSGGKRHHDTEFIEAPDAQALGPDLHGVAGRFSRGDLFTAIVQPSLDISPRYRTTLLATEDDKVYQGIVIYEAVDSLILQTGPATTVRLTNGQIKTRRVTETSLMPTGLLDGLADHEIADLYAYLRSLGGISSN